MRRCDGCGRSIPPGRVGYRVEIRLQADDQGVVTSRQARRLLDEDGFAELVEEASRGSPRELEDGVHQVIQGLICTLCRRSLVARGLTLLDGGS